MRRKYEQASLRRTLTWIYTFCWLAFVGPYPCTVSTAFHRVTSSSNIISIKNFLDEITSLTVPGTRWENSNGGTLFARPRGDLAKHGAKVVLTYASQLSKDKMDAIISKINQFGNGSAWNIACGNLRNSETPIDIVKEALDAFGPNIDILVKNVVVELAKLITEITVADFAKVCDLNTRGVHCWSKLLSIIFERQAE